MPKKKQPKAPPQPLTGKQKSHLRALAHPLKPVVQLGHQGLTDGVLAALDAALERHELIKLKLSSDADVKPAEIAPQIEKATRSQVAQVIGHTLVIYRRREKNPKIVLPRIKAAKAAPALSSRMAAPIEEEGAEDGGDHDLDDDDGDEDDFADDDDDLE